MSNWISGNRYLTEAEMKNNADCVFVYGRKKGWSKNAMSAMCGNMQAESGINPGIWEGLTPFSGGYGLVQWTPYTKYSNWAGVPWENQGDRELDRIVYEAENGLQWSRNTEVGLDPPITLAQFLVSTLPVATLSNYWLWFYEHPADPGTATQNTRAAYSAAWYDYFPDIDNIPAWLLFKFKKGRC